MKDIFKHAIGISLSVTYLHYAVCCSLKSVLLIDFLFRYLERVNLTLLRLYLSSSLDLFSYDLFEDRCFSLKFSMLPKLTVDPLFFPFLKIGMSDFLQPSGTLKLLQDLNS